MACIFIYAPLDFYAYTFLACLKTLNVGHAVELAIPSRSHTGLLVCLFPAHLKMMQSLKWNCVQWKSFINNEMFEALELEWLNNPLCSKPFSPSFGTSAIRLSPILQQYHKVERTFQVYGWGPIKVSLIDPTTTVEHNIN